MAVPFATPSFSSSDPILLSPPTHPALPSPNPDASAFASQARLGKLPSTEDTSASRSASLRRKPVPALLPMPNMHLPATHPFAAPSPKPGKTGDDSPASPGSARMDADLFFSPPARGTLPPPPRRAGMSPVLSAVRGKNEGGGDEMEILRVGGQVEEIVLGERVKRSPLPTPRSSPYDRPLPDLPVEAEHISPSLQESNTEDSMTELTTPRAPATYPAAAIKGESWDLADEVAFQDRMSAKPISSANLFSKSTVNKEKDKEKGKAKAIRVPLLPGGEAAEDETFSVDRIPSKRRLWEAGTCFLRDEQGQLVCFGDLFPRWDDGQEGQVLRNNAKGKPPLPSDPPTPTRPHPQQPPAHFGQSQSPPHTKQLTAADSSSLKKRTPRTVVFFIRHFWCGQCQDYTFASLSLLDPAAVAAAGIRVVIISNGSWKIIKSYRKLFNCPFPIYVDGPRRLYSLLGMTKMTNAYGPFFKGRAAYHQRVVPTQVLHGVSNALFRMQIGDPGKLTQLGGEFILSPGYTCDFAHRMTNTSDHLEAPDVLRLAGCEAPTTAESAEIGEAESQQAELERLDKEMAEWKIKREAELERIRRRKAIRRGEERDVPPVVPDSRPADALGFEMGKMGMGHVASVSDDMDERFKRVLAMEGLRREELLAAARLNEARGRVPGLDVHVEQEVRA